MHTATLYVAAVVIAVVSAGRGPMQPPQRGPLMTALINPEEFMWTAGGTSGLGGQENSVGNVLPEVTLPWAFNGWSPVTSLSNGNWFFSSDAHQFYGIRCTKQPSPWIGDYGQFRIASHIVDPNHGSVNTYSSYNPRDSTFSPYYFNATLLSYGGGKGFATVEVAPTQHGAALRFVYPPVTGGALATGWNQTRRVLVALDNAGANDTLVQPGVDALGLLLVVGASTRNSGSLPETFAHHFYATIGGGLDGAGNSAVVPIGAGVINDGGTLWAYFDFDPRDPATISLVLRVATSLISPAQASAAHAAEVAGVDFSAIMQAAKLSWHNVATSIAVTDVGAGWTPAYANGLLTTFYSSLYRASKYPRMGFELQQGSGAPIHWSPFSGTVAPGVMSYDVGFWDAYRTTPSLLALWRPAQVAQQMEGWLNAWREGGWVPQWSSPGYRGSMTGTMSDVTLSEMVVKLPHCNTAAADAAGYCVNASALYAASRQHAFDTAPPGVLMGRECLTEYMTEGFVAVDGPCDAVVTRSLNYYHADWALAQAAQSLNLTTEAATLTARSARWTQLLNPATGFLAPKSLSGVFLAEFDEFAWGPSAGYTEAGPWQHRVEVPFDPQGLKTALASIGLDACAVVQAANTGSSAFHMGGYGNIIHEMTEMAVNCWGQWELNNQPVWALQHMQVGFDTSVNGTCAQQAQKWLRQSVDLFKAAPDMFPGDEDNGSMGAWFVFNALGLYPLSPASGNYTLGSPVFGRVTIAVPGSATPLVISAVNQGPGNVYVQSVTWNGVAVAGVSVSYADLMQGGVLEFSMSATMA